MKWTRVVLLALLVALIVAQFIRPKSMANPRVDEAKTLYAVEQVPPEVRSILDRSCNDCHSSRTAWPWYAQIAPVSWFLADHVKDGRREMNVDEWGDYTFRRRARKLQETCEQVEQHEMPIKSYLRLHRDATLSDADRKALCDWSKALRASIIAAHPEAARPRQQGQPAPR